MGGIGLSGPALDAHEQTFDAGWVTLHAVGFAVNRAGRQGLALPLPVDFNQHWHQVLGVREDKHIRFVRVLIFGKPFVCLARNSRKRKIPTHTEEAVTSAEVVSKRKLRSEPLSDPRSSRLELTSVPVTGLAANFSPCHGWRRRLLGSKIDGALNGEPFPSFFLVSSVRRT